MISVFMLLYVRLVFFWQWWDVENVVFLLIGGSLFYGVYMIVWIGVNCFGRMYFMLAVVVVVMVVNIGFNFVFIFVWGIVGVGVSTIVGYSVLVFFVWLNV